MAATPSAREENVYMAKLAEQAERYEEMVELKGKRLLRVLSLLTNLLRISQMQNWLPLTQSVSDWLLTSQCFTTRFSTLQIVLAILPNRLLTRQLLSWIHWVRSHTRIAL
ncbi:hypothetical protein OIU76_002012 [Salix suchowensis]|nr:hypothetical protein OIU76_002012 [Salix suchowensis]